MPLILRKALQQLNPFNGKIWHEARHAAKGQTLANHHWVKHANQGKQLREYKGCSDYAIYYTELLRQIIQDCNENPEQTIKQIRSSCVNYTTRVQLPDKTYNYVQFSIQTFAGTGRWPIYLHIYMDYDSEKISTVFLSDT